MKNTAARITTEAPSNIFSIITRRHNQARSINRGSYEPSRLCKVYELDLRDPVIKAIPRAGVLFYTFIQGQLHICFGKDAKTGDLTDFGGQKRQGESPVKCAIREGNEESRKAFSEIKLDQIQGYCCLYSSNMLIIFIPVAPPNDKDVRELTTNNFKEKQFLNKIQARSRAYNEVDEIVWLDEDGLSNLFSPRPLVRLFDKVRRFIYSCTEISQDIVKMRKILYQVIAGDIEQYSPADLEQKIQNSLATIGSEVRNENKLSEWLALGSEIPLLSGSYYSTDTFVEPSQNLKNPDSPSSRPKFAHLSEPVSRRFIPEIKYAT